MMHMLMRFLSNDRLLSGYVQLYQASLAAREPRHLAQLLEQWVTDRLTGFFYTELVRRGYTVKLSIKASRDTADIETKFHNRRQ